ncbi:MAG: oligosaccharide flippase family protein [Chlorobi bacterium]|nr:oligosaccharide flippase family protein [Chlorobiota bacterium]
MSGGIRSRATGVLSQGLISAVAQGVNSLASFFAIIWMIRLMGKDPYGVFSLAIQITALTSMLADFGMGPIIMRWMAINPRRSASILLEASVTRLLLLVPTLVLANVIGYLLYPSWQFMMVLNVMMMNVFISSKVPVLRGTLEAFFRSQSLMGIPTLLAAFDSIVLLCLVLFLPALFLDSLSAMMMYTVANILGGIILLWLTLQKLKTVNVEPVRIQRQSIRKLLRESAPLAVFLLLNALHQSIDSIYLKLFHTDAAVSVYNAALKIMTPLAMFPTIIAISAAPFFARASISHSEEERQKTSTIFSFGIKTIVLGGMILAILGAFNAERLIHLVFPTEFDDAINPMIILFAVFFPLSINLFLVEMNNARGFQHRNTVFTAIMASVSIVAGFFLVHDYAATGASIAKLLAVVAGLAYLWSVSRRGLSIRSTGMLIKAVILALVLIAIMFSFSASYPMFSSIIVLFVFGTAIFAFRFFTRDEYDLWKSQLRSMLGQERK